MKILVLGGQGVVGAPLVAALRGRGHDVWVADKSHALHGKYIRCDIAHYRQLDRIFDEHKHEPFEMVYQLAAEFGRWNGEDYYEILWMTNAVGNKNVVRCQEKYGFRCVYFSSSEIYGDYPDVMAEDVPDHTVLRQLNDYAMSKWVNEQQVLNSEIRYGTESVRVRLFNTYGPGEFYHPYRSVICVFIFNALHGIPITVHRGYQRSSLYLDDCVRTLANITDKFVTGQVYNIANNESHDIEAIWYAARDYLGLDDSLVTYKDDEFLTTRRKVADCARAIRDLDHRCEVSLAEGIARTIDWAREYYKVDPVWTGRQGMPRMLENSAVGV